MIPKVIHYFWFSGEAMPDKLVQCMQTWREQLPDYELVKWDASSFDVECNAFVAEAFRARKWAFVTDYARIHALHARGGIYLDTDVAVRKPFDAFLGHGYFTALEYHPKLVKQRDTLALLHPDGSSRQPFTPKPGIGLQAAIMGAVAGHPFLKACLDYYADKHFVLPGGGYYDQIIAPDIYAMVAESYGFRYRDERQELRENMLILPSDLLAGSSAQETAASYAVHYCAGSWREPPEASVLKRAARAAYRAVGMHKLVHRYHTARRS